MFQTLKGFSIILFLEHLILFKIFQKVTVFIVLTLRVANAIEVKIGKKIAQ